MNNENSNENREVSQGILVDTLEAWKERATTLEKVLKETEEERDRLKNVVEYTGGHLKSWAEKWARAKALFEASLEEDGVDIDNLGHSTGRLVELFEIEFTEEVYITATIHYSGTLTLPRGYDLFDLEVNGGEAYSLEIVLNGEHAGELTHDSTDFDN